MPTRTTILIVVLTLFTTGLVVYSLILDSRKPVAKTTSSPTPTVMQPIEKTARLTFSPDVYTISTVASSSGTVDIVLDTGNHNVTGVQLEMQYDPQVLTSVTFATPSSSIWDQENTPVVELFKNIDQGTGRISYLTGIDKDAEAISGTGTVLTLQFRMNPASTTSTVITMLDKSLVMQENSIESVLNEKGTFTIISALPTKTSTSSANLQVTPTP